MFRLRMCVSRVRWRRAGGTAGSDALRAWSREVAGEQSAGQGCVAMMRVLRAELGIDLASAKAVARRVVNGDYSGTLPEMECLARKLRESGITAVAMRP